jgi:hypothetical protein
MKTPINLSCSAAFSQVITEAAVDVLGQVDAACLAVDAGCGVDIRGLIESLQQHFGPGGSKGVAQRLGQAAFKHFLDSYGHELNLTKLDYHLLPSGRRLRAGLEVVSQKLSEECGTQISMSADESAYYWHINLKDMPDTACIKEGYSYFLAGMAQGLLSWSGGGRFYHVREISDSTACILKMDQKPLD